MHAAGTIAVQAQIDLTTAYNLAAGGWRKARKTRPLTPSAQSLGFPCDARSFSSDRSFPGF
jgi:hypothetical protein